MQSKDIIDVLENEEAQGFIKSHIKMDLSKLSLQYSGKTNFNLAVCLELMGLYKKSHSKLPMAFQNLLALDQRSYEQSTSQAVATYKATFIKGIDLLDLTGGIGIDSIFLSKSFNSITAIELNSDLHELALYNTRKLGIGNLIRINGDGASYITTHDWVYIDPDRRVKNDRKVALENLKPNVLELIPRFVGCVHNVYLKLSPLFDIAEVVRNFDNVANIHIIAEKGEVKEVGVHLNLENKNTNPLLVLKDVRSEFNLEVAYIESQAHVVPKDDFTHPYLHISIALVAKSRLTGYLLQNVKALKHIDFELYNSEIPEIRGFKNYKILETSTLSSKTIKRMLKNQGVSKLNIVVKGLSDSPQKWHTKLQTCDGGEYYLFLLKGKMSESYLCKIITS